jgi:predicted PurR-regulated permease PerM
VVVIVVGGITGQVDELRDLLSSARGDGAVLGVHPLAVLIATIAGGAMFGAVRLLAAPLTSAATHVAADLSRSGAEVATLQPEPAAAP